MTTIDQAARIAAIREQSEKWGGTNTLIDKVDLFWLLAELDRQDAYIAALIRMVEQLDLPGGARITFATDGTAHLSWPGERGEVQA